MPDTPPALDGVSTVYLDCETDGLRWFAGDRPVGIALRRPGEARGVYLPFGHRGGGNLDESAVRRWAERELRGKRVVNLNTKFDLHMLRSWGVDLAAQGCTFRDVAHSAALLDDHRRGFSLEALSQDALGRGKKDTGPKGEIAELPAWDVADYALTDVELVEALETVYEPQLRAQGLLRVQQLEDDVIPVVVEMEHNGCPLDEALLRQWLAESEAALEQLLWSITRRAGFQVNPDKTEHLDRLFRERKIENPHRTASGASSYTAAFVKTITDPLIKDVYRAGKLKDLRAKFLVPYGELIHNGTLYCTFHQLMTGEGGTVSGRFSSARPNLQQVMKPGKQKKDYGEFDYEWDGQRKTETFVVKKLFREDNGNWFCADQEQVEFRIFGHLANAAKIIEAYRRDPHTDFHQIVTDMIRAVTADFPRDDAKNANFARLYGAGLKKFAVMINAASLDAAASVLRIYDREFPEAKRMLDLATRTAETRGYVKTLLGRRARFINGQRAHKALNAAVQGGAADLNKLCLVAVYKERTRLGLTMRLTVHDELNGRLEDRAMLPAVMDVLNTQQIPLRVPILWDGHVAETWADAK